MLPISCQKPSFFMEANSVASLSEDEVFRNERIEGYRRIVLIPNLTQMMFVAGETGEPSSETTTLIEQIVHEQVFEMVGFLLQFAKHLTKPE